MTATHITWSAILDGGDEPCATRRTSQILSLLPLQPDEAAAQVFGWWLEETPDGAWLSASTNWLFFLDDGDTEASALVVIHEPPEMAGTYAVEAKRVIEATGYAAEPDDTARAAAILAKHAEETA
jgi:hypothetical protein